MTKGKSRIISLFLAFIMIFTMLPLNVFAEGYANWYNGMSRPYTYTPNSKVVWGNSKLINDIVSMNGYRISVYFAELTGIDANGNPTYGWDDPTLHEQVGETIHWRRTPLVTKSGEAVGLDFWGRENIFSQTSQAVPWEDTVMDSFIAELEGEKFLYYTTDYQLKVEGSAFKGCRAFLSNIAYGLKAINMCGYSLYEIAYNDSNFQNQHGFQEVRSFFARILNMEHPEKADLGRFHNYFYQRYVIEQGQKIEDLNWDVNFSVNDGALWKAIIDTVGDYYGIPIQGKYHDEAYLESQINGIKSAEILAAPIDFQLPYPASMKEKTTSGINNASTEYLTSYFLNPLILNEISFMTGTQENGMGGYWQVPDFLQGVLDKGGVKKIGQYKIYIEPLMFRKYAQEGMGPSYGVMSWHDLMSAGQSMINKYDGNKSAVYKSFIGNMYMAAPQIANAMMLDEEDKSLYTNNDFSAYLGSKGLSPGFSSNSANDVWGKNGVYTELTNPLNTLGVSIVTSPSTFSNRMTPQIVKTYVSIEGVDDDGKIIYKKAADTVSRFTSDADFYLDDMGNLTVHPMFDTVEYLDDGDAILNDMFTTPYTLLINENTEWVNTDLITNVALSSDIKNYLEDAPDLVVSEKTNLEPTAADIAGYLFGIVTGSDVFVSNIEKYIGVAVTESTALKSEIAESIEEVFVHTSEDKASANEKITLIPRGSYSRSRIFDAIKEIESVKFDKFSDVGIGMVKENHIEKIDFTKDDSSYEILYSVTTPANTLVLRYILMPGPKQVNLIHFYEEAPDGTLTEIHTQVESPTTLIITGNEVTIQKPTVEIPKGGSEPEVVKWVTNSEYPIIGITNSLPPKSDGGKEGTTPDNIPNYPTDPLTHNLYVEWKVIIPKAAPVVGANQDVPEWRISKYLGAITDEYEGSGVLSATMSFKLKEDKGCKPKNKSTSLTPYGPYDFITVNANGRKNTGADTPANMNMLTIGSISSNIDKNYNGVAPNSWFHSKTFVYGGDSDTINHGDTFADIDLDATLNMIKSDDSGVLVAANWLTGNATGLSDYSITNGNKPKNYAGETEYTKVADLRLGVYNNDDYKHVYGKKYKHSKLTGRCKCTTGTEYFYKNSSSVNYTTANYSLDVIFDRYKQKDTSVFNLNLSNDKKVNMTNGLTTIKYQLDESIKIYPEVGMLFDSDANVESIRWMIGDKAREIKPVVWQTLEHKVYVKPTSTGTSVANDSRGITKANSIGEAGKQIIYKGAGVNTNFRLYQAKDSNKVGLLTMKTYALDFNTNTTELKALKNAWGNSAYNSYDEHKALLANFQNGENSKATVTEKLLVDVNPYTGAAPEFTGATKTVKSNPYKLVKYQNSGNIKVADGSNGDAVVFEHELIIRGGFVIGVRMDNHNGTKTTKTMEQLAASTDNNDISLFNALVGMNLYVEDGGKRVKNGTVLQTLEHKPDNAKILDEGEYASKLAAARRTVDGISTPDYATIKNGDQWYSEDTTVLIVREYVSNFEVPSISISDKLPMTISGTDKLNTPANKNEFFKELGKGHLYLKYNLDILPPAVSGITQNTLIDCYFEYTSLPNDVEDVKGFKVGVGATMTDTVKFGEEKVNYLVPNVSITDTTRMN